MPDNIRETLCSRYEYVVAEKEVIPDLTDDIRICETCTQWCPKCAFLSLFVYSLIRTRDLQPGIRAVRPVQEVLPHGMRAATTGCKASARVWLDVRTLFAPA